MVRAPRGPGAEEKGLSPKGQRILAQLRQRLTAGPLSPKGQRILHFLGRFFQEQGYPPTVRDILKGCQLSSTSVVDYHLRLLERAGYIRRDREVSRGIELLHPAHRPLVRVPVIGRIAAGEPIPVPSSDTWAQEALEVLDLPREMLRGKGEVYALRVKGTSMMDALIGDGDLVLLEPVQQAENGEMVAVWLKAEKEATLKKFYRERGRIRLQPANSQMKPLYVHPGNVEVQGRVIGVIRQMGRPAS